MIYLFVDTNIFLDFYHFSNEDLDNLKDLSKLIEGKKVTIFIPEQIRHEFYRNREAKIHDAIKRLASNDLKSELPQICLGYSEIKDLKNAEKIFKEKKKHLIDKLNTDIKSKSLKADLVINSLFEHVGTLTTTNEILIAVKKRFDIGDPPGKDGSLGDAINWETLLMIVPQGQDIHFVSGDTDYISPINTNEFSDFLRQEWETIKKSKLNFYKSFNQFLKVTFPEVKITTEDIKNKKIEAFENSPDFDAARARLNELFRINEFSDEQIIRIVEASVTNNQIFWAHDYSPEIIGQRLQILINGHEHQIPNDLYQQFCRTFGIDPIPRLREVDF
jgi:predicted nucleic acid-binding protein